jgi:hypothetical protein
VGNTERRARAYFDADTWEEDLVRTTPAGRQAAQVAREDYKRHGVPIAQLRRVAEHGHDRHRPPGLHEGLSAAAQRPLRDDLHAQVPARRSARADVPRLRRSPPPTRLPAPDRLSTRPSAAARSATAALNKDHRTAAQQPDRRSCRKSSEQEHDRERGRVLHRHRIGQRHERDCDREQQLLEQELTGRFATARAAQLSAIRALLSSSPAPSEALMTGRARASSRRFKD